MPRVGYNFIPPECFKCGLIYWPEGGQPVKMYRDNWDDPKWVDWLCADCRSDQWHDSDSDLSLREYLGFTELQYKYWVEGKWDEFADAYYGEE